MKKFPWIIHILTEHPAKDSLSYKAYLHKALNRAVETFTQPLIDEFYHNGKAGYEFWISQLSDESNFNENFKQKWHVNGWLYDLLFDSHHAAYVFFRDRIDLYEGEAQQNWAKILEKLDILRKFICEKWIHFSMPHWVNYEKKQTWIPPYDCSIDPTPWWQDTITWTEEMRKKGGKALKTILNLDIELFDLIQDFLN